MSKCEECRRIRIGVFRRPSGKLLCSDCNLRRIREMSPTGLIHNDERIARDLLQYYLACGMTQKDAFKRLEFILAMDPAMFTRLVPVIDELRQNYQVGKN